MKLNITARLVLGNTLAIVAVVGSYGYFNADRIRSIFSEQAARETSSRMTEVRERGLAEAKRVATNSAFALSNNDFGYLQNVLKPLVDADPGLAYAFLLDDEGALVAKGHRSGFEIPPKLIEEEKERFGDGVMASESELAGHRVLMVSVPISSDDRRWGRVVLGYSLKRLTEQLAALEALRSDEMRESAMMTFVFAVVLSIIGILATVLPSVSVTQPIITLTQAAERLAKGELGLSVDVKARGELGVLGSTFNRMSSQLAELVCEVKNKAALEMDLEVAETVQAALIPAPTLHRVDHLEITGRYIPASRCGGDWWSFFPVSEHKTLLVVGDVTGHGIPTTLITASVNACCEELQFTTDEMSGLGGSSDMSLREYLERRGSLCYLLAHLNRSILKVGRGRFLMTFSAALIDSKANLLTYANAGHEAPLLLPSGTPSVEPLHSGPSVRLGETATAQFVETTHPFAAGDTVVWYTDGLVDVTNPKRKTYGDGRLLRKLTKFRDGTVDTIAEGVIGDVSAFAQDTPAVDDITLVVVRRTDSRSST